VLDAGSLQHAPKSAPDVSKAFPLRRLPVLWSGNPKAAFLPNHRDPRLPALRTLPLRCFPIQRTTTREPSILRTVPRLGFPVPDPSGSRFPFRWFNDPKAIFPTKRSAQRLPDPEPFCFDLSRLLVPATRKPLSLGTVPYRNFPVPDLSASPLSDPLVRRPESPLPSRPFRNDAFPVLGSFTPVLCDPTVQRPESRLSIAPFRLLGFRARNPSASKCFDSSVQ
jgi:hypothetical protein